MMKKNMGNADRIVRVVLAVVVIGLFLANVISGWLGIALMVVAIIFLLTSLINFCPIYRVFGLSTCKMKH